MNGLQTLLKEIRCCSSSALGFTETIQQAKNRQLNMRERRWIKTPSNRKVGLKVACFSNVLCQELTQTIFSLPIVELAGLEAVNTAYQFAGGGSEMLPHVKNKICPYNFSGEEWKGQVIVFASES